MDLTITIELDGSITTSLFEKSQNLCLYIPPHSSHPRGVGTGLVFGQVLRIRRLCTAKADADARIGDFFNRLLERGHTREALEPLFARAEDNASRFLTRSSTEVSALRANKQDSASRSMFLHLEFPPEDPPSAAIQKLWEECISTPADETPLSAMMNYEGDQVCIDKLVIAYSRPLNLRNRFSVRNIDKRGEAVSTILGRVGR